MGGDGLGGSVDEPIMMLFMLHCLSVNLLYDDKMPAYDVCMHG